MRGKELIDYYKKKDFSKIIDSNIEIEEYKKEISKIKPPGIYNLHKYQLYVSELYFQPDYYDEFLNHLPNIVKYDKYFNYYFLFHIFTQFHLNDIKKILILYLKIIKTEEELTKLILTAKDSFGDTLIIWTIANAKPAYTLFLLQTFYMPNITNSKYSKIIEQNLITHDYRNLNSILHLLLAKGYNDYSGEDDKKEIKLIIPYIPHNKDDYKKGNSIMKIILKLDVNKQLNLYMNSFGLLPIDIAYLRSQKYPIKMMEKKYNYTIEQVNEDIEDTKKQINFQKHRLENLKLVKKSCDVYCGNDNKLKTDKIKNILLRKKVVVLLSKMSTYDNRSTHHFWY